MAEVLTADEERPPNLDLKEVLNYVAMADTAFHWIEQGRSFTLGLLEELQSILVRGTPSENASSGSIRNIQVVIGHRAGAALDDLPVSSARFVPTPPGLDLESRVRDLLDWMDEDHASQIDPVVAAGIAHYQFEALHPFHDGNGRIGRLLIVVHLLRQGVLSEPTFTVSPWFEARRSEYYDRLLAVSTEGDWDSYIDFFATALESSAQMTHNKMIAVADVQAALKERVRLSKLRADTAQALVDYAVGHPSFTVRAVQRDLNLSYGRANGLVGQLCELGVLAPLLEYDNWRRRFYAPDVLKVLVGGTD